MNIILVSGKLAKARTITLGLPHFLGLGVATLTAVVVLAALLHLLTLRFAAELRLPYFQALLLSSQLQQNQKAQQAP